MKVLYLTMATVDESSGVYKKIRAQAHAFSKLGCECRILFVTDGNDACYLKNTAIENVQFPAFFSEIKEYLRACDFCYARFELLRHKNYKKMLDLCKSLKIKIVLEIPTFPPYQESIARVKGKIQEKNYLGALKTLIGAGIVYSDMNYLAKMTEMVVIVADDYQFRNKKTIRIENGVDVRKNPYVPYVNREVINIIAVSNFAIWNGYDRAIEGMKNYPGDDVKLTFVGPLDKAADLRRKVKEYGLEGKVMFTGSLSGEALNEQYANSDIALGALGNHRRKVFANSSLKAKEYAARGMIMVLADSEGIEKEILEKSYVVRSDESALDIAAIAAWYRGIADVEKWKIKIARFALDHYSWNQQMKKIIDEIA